MARGKPFTKNDARINRAGAPKRGASWREIIAHVGDMTPDVAASRCVLLRRRLAKMGDGLTLRELAVMAAYVNAIESPGAALFSALADRVDGRPLQAVDFTAHDAPEAFRVVEAMPTIADIRRAVGVAQDAPGRNGTGDLGAGVQIAC